MALLFAIRVPPEATPLNPAYEDDDVDGFAPIRDHSLIGIRCNSATKRLALRLVQRKTIRNAA